MSSFHILLRRRANFVSFHNFSPFHRDGFITLTYFSMSSWHFHFLQWENFGTFYHKPEPWWFFLRHRICFKRKSRKIMVVTLLHIFLCHLGTFISFGGKTVALSIINRKPWWFYLRPKPPCCQKLCYVSELICRFLGCCGLQVT